MYNGENPRLLVAGSSVIARDFYDELRQDQLDVEFVDAPLPLDSAYDLIFVFTEDELMEKCLWVNKLEDAVSAKGFICVNVDGVGLSEIQEKVNAEVVGVNFCYPVTASPFMEIIETERNQAGHVEGLFNWAKQRLNKDPYIVKGGISVRAYMLAAMAREAFYLVDKGYASVESIDRACRNDAGYYLPFTGNYLYMDLMGTVAYAMVMKDLNPELSNSQDVPDWFERMVQNGKIGMKSLSGLYKYKEGDLEKWEFIVRGFSKEINTLITKYKKEYAEG
ncbi:3-hydroxyacyl-CoA dehydrogenase family protein [Sphingobacterium multivorum]|uniref:3-hydroxyacyl-CoA dehydrogenase family protein n=1 Tax=Sphingobacterium TaxID=28453 RepID=UPI0028B0092C|nr:3-hydroxyacyl-CoA dehydrogenase family protein [Sphingobacterium multivorum]